MLKYSHFFIIFAYCCALSVSLRAPLMHMCGVFYSGYHDGAEIQ